MKDDKCTTILVKNLMGRNLVGDLGLDGRIILKWIINKTGDSLLDPSGSGLGPVAGSHIQ
jgi:hypothetical protein